MLRKVNEKRKIYLLCFEVCCDTMKAKTDRFSVLFLPLSEKGVAMKRVACFATVFALLAGNSLAAYAAESPTDDLGTGDPLAGLDIVWVDTENSLMLLGRDKMVIEYEIQGYGGMMGHNTWGDYGLRNADGELLFPVQYGLTLPGGKMGNGRFAVGVEGETYTDYLGRTFTKEDCKLPWSPAELGAGRAIAEDGTLKYFYADPFTGETVLPPQYDEASEFSCGLGIVRVGEERFAIDRTGARVIDLNEYETTDAKFSNGYLRVQSRETGFWGYLDTAGELKLDCRWERATEFGEETLAAVYADGGWGLLDENGELVVPCVLGRAPEVKDGLAIVMLQGRQGILKLPTLRDECSAWAREELLEAQNSGLVVEECEHYRQYPITRRQFAALTVKWLEQTTGEEIVPASEETFTDTQETAILKAYAAGIVEGVGEGRFAPGGLLTREQLATMLWRAMKRAGTVVESPADLSGYTDEAQVSDWARESVSALMALEVLKGTGENTLSPRESSTVEQALLLVVRAGK